MPNLYLWKVIQGVILILVIINAQIYAFEMGSVHANHPVRTLVDAIAAGIDIRNRSTAISVRKTGKIDG